MAGLSVERLAGQMRDARNDVCGCLSPHDPVDVLPGHSEPRRQLAAPVAATGSGGVRAGSGLGGRRRGGRAESAARGPG